MVAQPKLKHHAALFDEMASHVGVDLEAIVVHEQFGHAENIPAGQHGQVVGYPDVGDRHDGFTLVHDLLNYTDFVETQ